MNGHDGVIVDYDEKADRYEFKLDSDGNIKKVKGESSALRRAGCRTCLARLSLSSLSTLSLPAWARRSQHSCPSSLGFRRRQEDIIAPRAGRLSLLLVG